MGNLNDPTLVEWAIVRVSYPERPDISSCSLTGVSVGHPRLNDGFQIVTTEIQEIDVAKGWARTKSRTYNLSLPLAVDGFTPELIAEVQDILKEGLGFTPKVERISAEEWRSSIALLGGEDAAS